MTRERTWPKYIKKGYKRCKICGRDFKRCPTTEQHDYQWLRDNVINFVCDECRAEAARTHRIGIEELEEAEGFITRLREKKGENA